MGRTSRDPRWRTIQDDGSPFPGEQHPIAITLETGAPQREVLMGVHKPTGELSWISINSSPLLLPGQPLPYAAVATFTDVTERRRWESQNRESQRALEKLATSDGLTGLSNYRLFEQRLGEEIESSRQQRRPLSLLMLDVDCFKSYNDRFGHPAGDAVLRRIATLLNESFRSSDLVARYGGEEFAMILPATDAEGARALGERFQLALAGLQWENIPVTVSIGAATQSALETDATTLIDAADRALYRSKHAGRNRLTHSQDPE